MNDAAFLSFAAEVAAGSPDTSKKVGCVITDRAGHKLLVSGFNSIPNECSVTPVKLERPTKYRWIEHAERRALNHAARIGVGVGGGTAYVTYFPCAECARSLVDSGIRRVVSPRPDITHQTWGESWMMALSIFRDAKVEVSFENVPE